MEKKTALVIEDNELNMKLVRGLLTIGGYRILEAENAEAGLAMAREHSPDLIFMDIQLPGMDGLSATRIIKEDPDLKGIPVIALSGYAVDNEKENARKAGCIGYIAKPIDTRMFLETVTRCLEKTASQ